MNGQIRKNIYPGLLVDIVLKADQPTGKLTRGVVANLLTSSPIHPRGVKVRLTSGQVGRVQHVVHSDSDHTKLIKPPETMIVLSMTSTFSNLFEILKTTDPTQKYSRFYKKLDIHFTPDIVDDIYDFQHDKNQEDISKTTTVIEYFQEKGFDKESISKFLSVKFLPK
jgi:uncharacterized repeat protein (TIGR03833 family)